MLSKTDVQNSIFEPKTVAISEKEDTYVGRRSEMSEKVFGVEKLIKINPPYLIPPSKKAATIIARLLTCHSSIKKISSHVKLTKKCIEGLENTQGLSTKRSYQMLPL